MDGVVDCVVDGVVDVVVDGVVDVVVDGVVDGVRDCVVDGTVDSVMDGIVDGNSNTVGPGPWSMSPTNVGKSVAGGDDGYKEFANKDDGGIDGDVLVP